MINSHRGRARSRAWQLAALAFALAACGGKGAGAPPSGFKPNAPGRWIVTSCRRVHTLEAANELSFTIDCGDILEYDHQGGPGTPVVLLGRLDGFTGGFRPLLLSSVQSELDALTNGAANIMLYANQTNSRGTDYVFAGDWGALDFSYELHLALDPPIGGSSSTTMSGLETFSLLDAAGPLVEIEIELTVQFVGT